MTKPDIQGFFDESTNTISYVVRDSSSTACAVVDSVLDFDAASGRTSTAFADQIITYVKAHDLTVEWILETHVHADHLSAAPFIQQALGGKIGIGANITIVQGIFGKIFNAGSEFERDGSQFDRLFRDGDAYRLGGMTCLAMHTPGHTPGSLCLYRPEGQVLFSGDLLVHSRRFSTRSDVRFSIPQFSVAPDAVPDAARRLLDLPIEVLCCGHGEPITTAAGERIRRLLNRSSPRAG